MINSIPIVGWVISVMYSASLSLPFWLFWSVFGIGGKYFYWLPPVYQHIPFWDCIELFLIVSIFKDILPKLVYVQQQNIVNKDKGDENNNENIWTFPG